MAQSFRTKTRSTKTKAESRVSTSSELQAQTNPRKTLPRHSSVRDLSFVCLGRLFRNLLLPSSFLHQCQFILEADLQPLNSLDQGRWRQLMETAALQSGTCPWWW